MQARFPEKAHTISVQDRSMPYSGYITGMGGEQCKELTR